MASDLTSIIRELCDLEAGSPCAVAQVVDCTKLPIPVGKSGLRSSLLSVQQPLPLSMGLCLPGGGAFL